MAIHVQDLLQIKIFEILSNDATLSALINGVFDNVPDNLDPPFVVIGDTSLSDFGSHTHSGFQGELTIHAWSEDMGRKKIMTIMNRIYTLLHNIDLAITNYKTIVFRCETNEILVENDNRTHQGVQTYKIMLGGN